MALYVCHRCVEEEPASSQMNALNVHGGQTPFLQGPLARVRALVGSVLGGLLGLLSGNPVLVLLGAAVGSSIATASSATASQPAGGVHQGVCESCGAVAELERCAKCGERVCSSCRELVMAEEEREGRRVYRHYEKADEDDEPGALALAPWYVSDEPDTASSAGYRLGEEAYEIDEESGQLIPVAEEDSDESTEVHGLSPTDEWDFDSASVSPATTDWESSDAWSSMDQDIDGWETDSADSEGGCDG